MNAVVLNKNFQTVQCAISLHYIFVNIVHEEIAKSNKCFNILILYPEIYLDIINEDKSEFRSVDNIFVEIVDVRERSIRVEKVTSDQLLLEINRTQRNLSRIDINDSKVHKCVSRKREREKERMNELYLAFSVIFKYKM